MAASFTSKLDLEPMTQRESDVHPADIVHVSYTIIVTQNIGYQLLLLLLLQL